MYPIFLLAVIGIFIGIAYLLFSSSRRSEQNRVWTGMAKETAHQIGTPLSSLMGWIEILRTQNADEMALTEMEKDVNRLQMITDRFSKIGSTPQMSEENISETVQSSFDYMKSRVSKKIDMTLTSTIPSDQMLLVNTQLLSWVIENLVRNAIDSIEGGGFVKLELTDDGKFIRLDVADSGKGIPIAQQNAIFRPGYTTKKRGWGLGLSLAKRIIEEYHKGKISVAVSEVGKGTTFRVLLPKTN
jgi:signal transduction histidine kinase